MTEMLLQRIREATRASHLAIEARADARGVLRCIDGVRFHVGRLHTFFRMLDPIFARFEHADASWMRSALMLAALHRDLRTLSVDAEALRAAPELRISSRAEALGAAYVVCGSALGGIAIRRALASNCVDVPVLESLGGCPEETRRRWRTVLDRLESTPAEERDAVVEGARTTFAGLLEWYGCRGTVRDFDF